MPTSRFRAFAFALTIICLALLPLRATAQATQPASKPQSRPPNVVLILVDDLGWTDLACFGSKYYETPQIDRLCAGGMKFTQAYAACAVCSPTRAAVMTGRYPMRVGITDWIRPLAGTEWTEAGVRAEPAYEGAPNRRLLTPRVPRWMEHDEITLAELLHKRGYATGYVGKWHLGPPGWFPEDQGFDFNAGGCDFGHPPHYFDPYPPKHQRTTFPNLPPREKGEYLAHREAAEAVRFIEQVGERPFFLCLAPYEVHSPLQAPRDLVEKYKAKPKTNQKVPVYAGMVESVDNAVGAVVATLERLKLRDNTLIIFTSDNGGATHFPATDNAPLRFGKGYPYEGGLRVPLIVNWPGKIASGTQCDVPVSSIDLLPTIAAITQAETPQDRQLDGLSLVPLLRQTGELKRDTLLWHFPHYWYGRNVRPYSIIRVGDWKLIHQYETDSDELYNLADDLSEEHNLAAQQSQRTRELRTKLEQMLQAMGAKLPKPNPDFERE